jgi:colicin import membrane protein
VQDTAIGLLRQGERLWPTVVVSLLVHASAVGLAVLYRPAPIIDLEQKPIVAKLVRLGEVKPESYLPRKEEEPPPPSAAAPVPIPGPAPAPEPVAAPKAPPKPTPAVKPGGDPNPKPSNALATALNRVRREQLQGSPTYGDPSGDPEGDSSEASVGDRYLALVTRQLQTNYRLPSTLSDKDRMYLKAVIVLIIEPDGSISRFRFESRSGNGSFDDALERAVRQTRLPPPPPELRERYRTVGLGVRFHV